MRCRPWLFILPELPLPPGEHLVPVFPTKGSLCLCASRLPTRLPKSYGAQESYGLSAEGFGPQADTQVVVRV